MSWSIELNGTPDEVVAHLEEYGATLFGQSRIEYKSALPYLVGLVRQTFTADPSESPRVELSANGTGLAKGVVQLNRSCSVMIRPFYGAESC